MEGLVGTNDLNGFHGAFKERMTTSIAVGGGMKKSKDEINLVYVDHPMTLHPVVCFFLPRQKMIQTKTDPYKFAYTEMVSIGNTMKPKSHISRFGRVGSGLFGISY